IGVLEQVGAVEVAEPVLVGGEVRRDPVEDHSDAGLMQRVDQVHEVLGCPVAAGRGEIAGRLIAPRPVERVLHHRQELDVGEPQRGDVLGELGGQLPVGEEALGIGRVASPRAQVHLVDADRVGEAVAFSPGAHPLVVFPLVGQVPDLGGGPRGCLVVEGERVGLVDQVRPVADAVLVGVRSPGRGHEGRPHPRRADRSQRVGVGVPAVPVPDHRHPLGVGGPHREVGALTVGGEVRSHLLVETEMRPLVPQVDVVVGEERELGGGVHEPMLCGRSGLLPSAQAARRTAGTSTWSRGRKTCTMGPTNRAKATVPTPNVPPRRYPITSTTTSSNVRVRRMEGPNLAIPVINPSRGPGPRLAPMYSPEANPTVKIPPASMTTRHSIDSGSGSTRAARSKTTPMTRAVRPVARPNRAWGGIRRARTRTEPMIDNVPIVRPNCRYRPWWRTSQGGTPRRALSIIASPVPNSTSPAIRLARRRARSGPRAGMIRLGMGGTNPNAPAAFQRVGAGMHKPILRPTMSRRRGPWARGARCAG